MTSVKATVINTHNEMFPSCTKLSSDFKLAELRMAVEKLQRDSNAILTDAVIAEKSENVIGDTPSANGTDSESNDDADDDEDEFVGPPTKRQKEKSNFNS